MFLDLTFVDRRVMENSLLFPNANSIKNKFDIFIILFKAVVKLSQ